MKKAKDPARLAMQAASEILTAREVYATLRASMDLGLLSESDYDSIKGRIERGERAALRRLAKAVKKLGSAEKGGNEQ